MMPAVAATLARQASTHKHLVELLLHGRPLHTQRVYRADSYRFRAFVARPLTTVTLGDVQAFADSVATLAPSSRAAHARRGQVAAELWPADWLPPLNVGAAVKLPPSKNTLAERILTEPDVVRIVALEPNRRNQVLLRLLYIAGLRVSEIAALTWSDLQPRTDGGQVTVFGKGGKTRVVLLPSAIWRELLRFRQGAGASTCRCSRHGAAAATCTHRRSSGWSPCTSPFGRQHSQPVSALPRSL